MRTFRDHHQQVSQVYCAFEEAEMSGVERTIDAVNTWGARRVMVGRRRVSHVCCQSGGISRSSTRLMAILYSALCGLSSQK